MKSLIFATTFASLSISFWCLPARADSAAELLPPSTIFYAEIKNPEATLSQFLAHPYFEKLKKLEPYQELTKKPQFMQGMLGLRFVEFQLGMTWRDAVKSISAGGVTLAFDAETQGVAVMFKAEDAEKLQKITDKVIEFVRKDAEKKGKADPYTEKEYRGLTVYGIKKAGFVRYKDWLIVGNQSDLGKKILDALLDGREQSLADNPLLRQTREQVATDSLAWAFLNLEPLRQADDDGLRKLFSGKADDPGGELILGGVQEGLKTASHVTASLQAGENGLSLNVMLPFDPSQMAEEREHYLGPNGTGEAATLLQIPDQLLGLTVYRNVSEMWLRSGDLFNEQVNDGLAQADSNLSTFFSGKDFGEDILGALTPQMQLLAARQQYAEDRPIPAIKIPAFALVATMKQPEVTTREFRRIFYSFIGFFNVVGAMNGQPQFELGFADIKNGDLVSATPVPEIGEETQKNAKINYNFSPTMAFAGEKLILSSSTELARTIAEQAQPVETSENNINTRLLLNVPQIHAALDDNRSHLVAQNVLKEGHSQAEAEQQIGILLDVLSFFKTAQLQLTTGGSQLKVTAQVHLND